MWNTYIGYWITLTASYIWIIGLPGIEGLQCYNCRGITNYDPNECFTPVAGKTVLQECRAGEVCEKRVTMVDRLQDVIDRGCSANCAGRKFVWTDEFQVYCCNNQDYCNGSTGKHPNSFLFMWTVLVLAFCFIFKLTI